ncbi:MAG: glutamine--fructose-6-phosphate transaminase (isomerizing) [Rhodospirillales bacterium]|nr:glutamine--fructose-6-phosphate transaminase (isomerizing) [Alphaproteobacteria bacterium]USO05125.1 MAG: glutamine--fructose-6-phosphate transaminase (isomerizing) [Rhodospirillales bacterium]
MCGIIGILSEDSAAPLLIEGLRRLEYRGYDSAGIATLHDGVLDRRRSEGKLKNLEIKLKSRPLKGTLGIGHTRWATHGGPTEDNAHPHATDKVAVVHNGIIENYAQLKEELANHQIRFETDTDTEVIVHLVDHYLTQGKSPQEAASTAFDRLDGAYAIVMIFAGQDNLMIGCRQGTPLAVGYGDGEMFVASDSYALAPLTKKICFLEDGDRVTVTREGAQIYTNDDTPVTREIRITAQSGATTGKGNFRHFMLKEIYEQPSVIGDTLNSFVNPATGEISIPPEVLAALADAPRITMVACGTAYYACMVAKYWFEQTVGIPCDVDIASEFRYREPPLASDTLCIVVSQSGETLDTLEGMRYAKSEGCKVLSIVNTIESTIERESDFVMHTLAGPEIGVASTKAFTTQLTTLACIALSLAVKKGALKHEKAAVLADELRHIPQQITQLLREEENTEIIQSIARDIFENTDMLYLGRNLLYPLAMEGALKLKEVSYIHAEGYAAGELKHGPIALIDDHMPIVVLAPAGDALFEKTASNLQENVARGAKVLLISDESGHAKLKELIHWGIKLQPLDPFVAPILYAVPIQLLAYHVAVTKGTDVDQPRNLAKSVTVE